LDVSWPEDHWFSMLARFSYNNRIKTLAQAKEFLEFAARLDIR
jgi:spermidine/putrescine-binding protein